MEKNNGCLWQIFWMFVFVLFILPWACFPIALGLWEDDEPKWFRWVCDQCTEYSEPKEYEKSDD